MDESLQENPIKPKINGNFPIKKVLLVAFVVAILGGVYYIYSNTNLLKSKDIENSTKVETNTGVDYNNKTLADIFCLFNKGTIETITTLTGGIQKQCHLVNGKICDEELYYKGECPIKYKSPETIFCEQNSGRAEFSDLYGSRCYLLNGTVCGLDEFYEGRCPVKEEDIDRGLNVAEIETLNCPGREKQGGKIYYYGSEENITGVDVQSFEFVDCLFAKDKDNIYMYESGDPSGGEEPEMKRITKQIDVLSFESKYSYIYTTDTSIYCGYGLKYIGDKTINWDNDYKEYHSPDLLRLGNKIYYDCDEVIGADADSFEVVPNDVDHILGKDKNYIYVGTERLPLINSNNFQLKKIGNEQFIKNDNIMFLINPNIHYSKIDVVDPSSFGLRNESISYDIFKDGKGNLFYACGNGPNSDGMDYRVNEMIRVEGINLDQLKVIDTNFSTDIYGILEDDKYRYTIKCDQEDKVIRTSK